MRPKKHETTGSGDLFRARLDQIINMRHELVQLAGKIDWEFIDGEIAPLYSDSGRPGIATRFVIGLFLLKHISGLSDEGVCERWVYDPYFQHFTGEEFFQHEFPHERSDLSHWRKRLGDKLELLLAESLRVAHESGALRTKDLARVTVDTTVQPKNITFPTDAKLLHAAIKGLTRLARKHGVRLRQSYVRIAKRAAMMAGRYAHAKQFNRHRRQLRILRTRLGRLPSSKHVAAAQPDSEQFRPSLRTLRPLWRMTFPAQDRAGPQQFPMDTWRAPQRIGLAHAADQITNSCAYSGSSWTA
jgi:transposase, IS5 family